MLSYSSEYKKGSFLLKGLEYLDKTDSIYILDFFILEKVKKYLIGKDFKICVNLSPKTIIREDFLEKLNFSKEEAKNLEIEITERGEFSYTELTHKILELKKLGIKVIMDDFPIGSSSLENLLKIHIDGVKIDRELIKNLNDAKGKDIYKSVVRFLKELGSEITAEGVELVEELNFIKDIGVDLVQGYYIGKPIAERQFLINNFK